LFIFAAVRGIADVADQMRRPVLANNFSVQAEMK